VRDPGAWVAAAVSVTVVVLIISDLVLAGSTFAGVGGGTVFLFRGGFRARLIALTSFSTLDVGVTLLVAAVFGRVIVAHEHAHFRRLAFLGLAALSAVVAVAALVRGLLIFTFLGRTFAGSVQGLLAALAVIPVAGVAAILASEMVEGPHPHHR
jgi:hypothetical protein